MTNTQTYVYCARCEHEVVVFVGHSLPVSTYYVCSNLACLNHGLPLCDKEVKKVSFVELEKEFNAELQCA